MMLTHPRMHDATDRQNTRMSAEEEQRLAQLWKNEGDGGARERLVTENLGLVVAIAQTYRQCGVPLDELIAEGNLGLLHAVDGFDPDRGFRLSTYAAYWIRQGISRAFAASSPRGQMNGRDRRDVAAVEQAVRVHYATSGCEPTLAELSAELDWPRERVAACMRLAARFTRPSSLDQPHQPVQPASGGEAARSGDGEEQASAAATVATLFEDLTDRERAVVEMRFGMHGSEAQGVDEIAASLEASRRETRVLLRTALAKIARRRHALSPSTRRELADLSAA